MRSDGKLCATCTPCPSKTLHRAISSATQERPAIERGDAAATSGDSLLARDAWRRMNAWATVVKATALRSMRNLERTTLRLATETQAPRPPKGADSSRPLSKNKHLLRWVEKMAKLT